jgi:para-nitrobenzyl esterase
VFDTLDAFPWLVDGDDQNVSDLISGYWVNFIKTGNPNGKGLPAWPSYREASKPVLVMDTAPRIDHDIDRARHDLLSGIV